MAAHISTTTSAVRALRIPKPRTAPQLALSSISRAVNKASTGILNRRTPRFFTHTAPRSIRPSALRSTAPPATFFHTNRIHPSPTKTILQQIRVRLLHMTRVRRITQVNPTPHLGSPKAENLSLGQKMRKLSREYGWAATGVYFALSALDFPFCYLFVRTLGTEKISKWEHTVVTKVKSIIPESVKQAWHEWRSAATASSEGAAAPAGDGEDGEMVGWGVEEAEESYKKNASLGTQLALAYAIHKSFIFIRVPLAAAITPNVVRVLRGWGWDIGKRTTKATKIANAAEVAAVKAEKKAVKAEKKAVKAARRAVK